LTALSGPVAVQSISLTAVVTWLPSSSTSGGVAADLMVAAVTLDPGRADGVRQCAGRRGSVGGYGVLATALAFVPQYRVADRQRVLRCVLLAGRS